MTKQQLQLELEHVENCLELIYENCKIIDSLGDFDFDEVNSNYWKFIRKYSTKEFNTFDFCEKVDIATDYTTYFRNILLIHKNLKKRELNKLIKAGEHFSNIKSKLNDTELYYELKQAIKDLELYKKALDILLDKFAPYFMKERELVEFNYDGMKSIVLNQARKELENESNES